MVKEVTSCMEIRHLPRPVVSELGNILQIDHTWKDIMGLIPENLDFHRCNESTFIPKYSSDDICLVSEECDRTGRTGLEILIEEWGTSGQIRPKVSDLLYLLKEAGLERAALYLDTLTNDGLEKERPSEGEEVMASLEIIESQAVSCTSANPNKSSSLEEEEVVASLIESQDSVPFFSYEELMSALDSGIKIGEGAFGSVYKAYLGSNLNKTVGIKILFETDGESKAFLKKETIFKTEVDILSKCSHKNIIKLEGYSYNYNQDNLCLLYEFMENGSLYDRLGQLHSTPPLPWKLRLNIGEGIAKGVVYLHTKFDPPLVHRDIKSPNILLDQNFIPKLGDFGIVRLGAHGRSTGTVVKTTPVGTPMYMAPEAFRGDVSVKMDTFSYAIVILELLTGLPFYDEAESIDLLSYFQEYKEDKISLLDSSAGSWDTSIGRELFKFSEICTQDKKDRPDMVQALAMLQNIFSEL